MPPLIDVSLPSWPEWPFFFLLPFYLLKSQETCVSSQGWVNWVCPISNQGRETEFNLFWTLGVTRWETLKQRIFKRCLMAKKYKKISMPTCHYHWISSGTVRINQCMSGCHFHVSEHLRSCTELQILKLGGSFIDHLAECPNFRKQSVIDSQCSNAGQVGPWEVLCPA